MDGMKFFVVIPDGAAERFEKNTALSLANTPFLDSITPKSLIGIARTIPINLPPGSDVGILSIFGFDPLVYAKGRSPLELAAKRIILPSDAVVFRMNLVLIENDTMKDHSAGHIKDEEAQRAVEKMKSKLLDFLKKNNMELLAGKSYRNFLIWKIQDRSRSDQILKANFTPPHDILGQNINDHLEIYDKVAPELAHIMRSSREILKGTSANMVWFWGQGKRFELPQFEKVYGKKGYLVSAVDIVKGIAVLSGLEVLEVPGITGYLDSNFEGKVDAIVKNLKDDEVGFIHIEATDETGHEGNREKKKLAVEILDRRIIGYLLESTKGEDITMLVIPDHQTPCEVRTHVGDPVPFIIYPCPICKGKGCSLCGRKRFTELDALSSPVFFDAKFIMRFFLSNRK